jgi:isopentenyl phosphate kinase
MDHTYFLKLGGSLITNKDQTQTALLPQIDIIARQINNFIQVNPEVHLLVGHGSGSFGHVAASKYHTREGVKSPGQWQGFAEVWLAARELNQILIERFAQFGLPVISFPLSAGAVTKNGSATNWNIHPIEAALQHHLLPVVYGDVVLDETLGGTILSTEEQFAALVPVLKPAKILLAGREVGVWQDYPACTTLIDTITPSTYPALSKNIIGSASTDVTGGMVSKVESMLSLIQKHPQLQIQIFSGSNEEAIFNALSGEQSGTILRSDVQGVKNEIRS